LHSKIVNSQSIEGNTFQQYSLLITGGKFILLQLVIRFTDIMRSTWSWFSLFGSLCYYAVSSWKHHWCQKTWRF